jgi:hypothetical protein
MQHSETLSQRREGKGRGGVGWVMMDGEVQLCEEKRR